MLHDLFRLEGKGRLPGRRGRPQCDDVDPRLREFHGVTDEPALELGKGRLRMELKADHRVAEAERLVLAELSAGQVLGARRQFEGVAVPVERERVLRKGSQAGAAACFRELDGREADLGLTRPVHGSACGPGNELGAEADAHERLTRRQKALDQGKLPGQEGIDCLVVGADGTAEHDEQVRGLTVRR